MSAAQPILLDVEHLRIALPAGGDRSHALHDVSLHVREGECLCVVGESGSGKSMPRSNQALRDTECSQACKVASWQSGR